MAMKLEGGERLVLKTLVDLQGDLNEYVEDNRLAAATRMAVQDVRDWLDTLEGKGLVERTRLTDGFSAYVTAKGKQALRLTEPIGTLKSAPTGAGSGSIISGMPNASTVFFDEAHGQIGWFEQPTIDGGLRPAADSLANIYQIQRNTENFFKLPMSDTRNLLIIPTPFRTAVNRQEYDAVTRWVFAGNGLLVLGFYLMEAHHRFNLNDLVRRFGFEFLCNLIMPAGKEKFEDCMGQAFGVDAELCVSTRPVGNRNDHPLLSGVERIAIQSACSAEPASRCELVVSTEAECSVMRATGPRMRRGECTELRHTILIGDQDRIS